MNRALKKTVPTSKWAFCYVVLIVISTFSLLYGWIPAFHSQAYIAVISILLSLIIVPRFFLTSQFYLILCYAAVVWYNANCGDPYTFDKKVMDGLMLCMSASISYYLLESDDQRCKKFICISILLILIVQTITTFSAYITSNGTIRVVLEYSSKDQKNADWGLLYKMGILSFDTLHSVPLLVPPLIMWMRERTVGKKWKLLCLSSLIFIVLLVYIYDITTVQILTLFCLGTSMLIKPHQNKKNTQRILILLFLLFPITLSIDIQDGILSIVENFSEGSLKEKIGSTRYNLAHDASTGDFSYRRELYTTSFETFLESPIIGKDSEEGVGGHSAIVDRLGAFGILGFVPFILVIFTTSRFCISHLSNSLKYYFFLSAISFFILLTSKNMCRLEEWLSYLIILPSMLTLRKETVNKI